MNNNESYDVRVSLLEQDADTRRLMLVEISRKQELQSDAIDSVSRKMDLILARKHCESPGLCIPLQDKVIALEMARAEQRGGMAALSAVAAAASVVGGMVVAIAGHFYKK